MSAPPKVNPDASPAAIRQAILRGPAKPSAPPVVVTNIPAALRACPHWVAWAWRRPPKAQEWRKIPKNALTGSNANHSDPSTWAAFDKVLAAYEGQAEAHLFDGIGFVLLKGTRLLGIDIDNCRHPANGYIEPWAQSAIELLNSYTEVSPTGTGVKIFVKADVPLDRGHKRANFEFWNSSRYFIVTGQHLAGTPPDIEERSAEARELYARVFGSKPALAGPATTAPTLAERVAAYLAECPPAISGQNGHATTLTAARAVVWGFDLGEEAGYALLAQHYNPRCEPPWSERELRHKCRQADTVPFDKPRGYLLNEAPTGPASPVQTPPHSDRPKPKFQPSELTALDLMAMELPPIVWAVEGLIPEGASLLAGRPKIGKSWLQLHIALAVAAGGVVLGKIPVEPRPVLYLALEDSPRRMQGRLRQLSEAQRLRIPNGLNIEFQWPQATAGGLDALYAWLDTHPATGLVLIDTLAAFRDRSRAGHISYQEDYDAIATLHRLALDRSVPICLATHTRKSRGGDGASTTDFIDEVQHTSGLTGAADVTMVLARARNARVGQLAVTGRDIEERTIPLRWDPGYCLWQQADDPDANDPDAGLTPEQRKVRRIVKEHGGPITAASLAPKIHKDVNACQQLLGRMTRNGLLCKVGHGLYDHPDRVSASSACQDPATSSPPMPSVPPDNLTT